ncbi:MAG: ATP-binding protein [Candidatus Methylomirabilia bacterium]
MARGQNPFVFGEIVEQSGFVDREQELKQLVRDLADGQKLFLLSPRRFGKSSLVAVTFQRLRKQRIRTVSLTVSSYTSYAQFLEKFAQQVLRTGGGWNQVKGWVTRFLKRVRPELKFDPVSSEVTLGLTGVGSDPAPLAPEIFAMPGELARNAGVRMAICLDEFQQIANFDSRSVENALRNEVQKQRQVGYVFAGSQPSLVEEMLSRGRPFHGAGPKIFLDKIAADAWKEFIVRQFHRQKRALSEQTLDELLKAADLIPYDVQRIAHELWDYAEETDKRRLDVEDLNRVIDRLVASQSVLYERMWEQLTLLQRAVLRAVTQRGKNGLLSAAVREAHGLGPPSSVQKALQSLHTQDILDRYKNEYFLVDPIFAAWIRKTSP